MGSGLLVLTSVLVTEEDAVLITVDRSASSASSEDSQAASEEDSIPLIDVHSWANRTWPAAPNANHSSGVLTSTLDLSPSLLSASPGPAPRSQQTEVWGPWDYVLVANLNQNPKQCRRQQQFLEELQRKGFQYKEMQDQHKKYFGVRAKTELFLQYCRLLMEPEGPAPEALSLDEDPTLDTTRIRIINTFIQNTRTEDREKFEDLKKDKVFETGFFLHSLMAEPQEVPGVKPEGTDKKLREWAQWRNMFCKQPIDDIRNYFGEKVALYFAWLGWYTCMLMIAAAVGLLIFLSGFAHFNASQISKEICEAHDIFLCPRGDNKQSQRLSDTCTYAKLTHLFDNEGTVVFAIFMALWATVFLEVWKRKRSHVVQNWHLCGWDEDEEEMMLELMNYPQYQPKWHEHSYLRSAIILLLSLFMICLMIGMAHVLVVYRVLAAALFKSWVLSFMEHQVTTVVVVSGALVHYVTIVIMTKINRRVALMLCDYEKPRTFSERESKFTVKFFTLQFFAHFSSLFYVAFILGRINGHPGKSVRLAGLWKLEECHLSGCMMDLFVQMAIIMGLKQTLSNCAEYLSPWLSNKCRRFKYGRASQDPELRGWQHNYLLGPVTVFSLFDEFMEMMMQYGFTTIFVAAFPLAPLLALFSNLVEIRLDAIKMVRLQQRLVPRKAKDIGTWLQVLETIGVLAVITNGLVIAFTSEFIPRVVYKYYYGPCRGGARPAVDCLTGYVNHSLSVFYTKDFENDNDQQGWETVTECRYRDYRNADDYNLSQHFWVLLAIRLVFLILFEHVALCIKLIAAWFVPDVPRKVNNEILKSKFKRVQEKMRQKLQCGVASPPPASSSCLRSTPV
ncbi:PREDICTED: anoctamin-9 [Chrysochloris asiatica]|uniref:Anoctamin n=1 Tax=Chrysochloris asiatica TaxID=185453 RepID=A0A9B0U6X9_CHRAS|nr:PREDICTED: anoctamin-9 [Chrysochloris asiatica]